MNSKSTLKFNIIILSVLLLFSVNTTVSAATSNEQAYIERQTFFNNITDALATIGKSKKERITIKRARWLARRKARLIKIREKNKKNRRR